MEGGSLAEGATKRPDNRCDTDSGVVATGVLLDAAGGLATG